MLQVQLLQDLDIHLLSWEVGSTMNYTHKSCGTILSTLRYFDSRGGRTAQVQPGTWCYCKVCERPIDIKSDEV